MSINKIRGRDAKPILVFVLGFALIPVCFALSIFSSLFVYPMVASIVLALSGLVWFVLRRRHDNAA